MYFSGRPVALRRLPRLTIAPNPKKPPLTGHRFLSHQHVGHQPDFGMLTFVHAILLGAPVQPNSQIQPASKPLDVSGNPKAAALASACTYRNSWMATVTPASCTLLSDKGWTLRNHYQGSPGTGIEPTWSHPARFRSLTCVELPLWLDSDDRVPRHSYWHHI